MSELFELSIERHIAAPVAQVWRCMIGRLQDQGKNGASTSSARAIRPEPRNLEC